MAKLPTRCPSCSDALRVSRLTCPSCDLQLEGSFALPVLLRLSEDDLAFVLEFVKASGSLKQMAKLRGQSYPTIRNRLNDLIEKLEERGAQDASEQERHRILDAIAKGELSVEEASAMLRAVGSPGVRR